MLEVFSTSGRTIDLRGRRRCFELYARHQALMRYYDVMTPKHHLIVHLIDLSEFHGNPTLYATWFDESLNKVLKKACRERRAKRRSSNQC